jgi:mercuric ion binding protein
MQSGESTMKKMVMMMLLASIWSVAALAAGTQYQMRVDGLACPYCAYGIEKKLNAIDGVEKIDIDLENGLVIVNVTDGVKLSDEQMTQLFNDSGFTYRSKTEKAL